MKNFRINLRKVATAFACLAAATVMSGCEEEPNAGALAFAEFTFANQRGTSDIDAKKRTVKAIAECRTNLASIAPVFELSPEGATATVGGKVQESGKTAHNFAEPVVYTLTTPDGATAEWTVTITLPDDCPQTKIKSGTIIYDNVPDGDRLYYCFDEYSEQQRLYVVGADGDWAIYISDEINGLFTVYTPGELGWIDVPASSAGVGMGQFSVEQYAASLAVWEMVPGATKTTATVAGQTCTVYKMNGLELFAAWRNDKLLFVKGEEGEGLIAKSAREDCPAHAFEKVIDIDWE
ncbi:MAG: hypothetical protein LBS46_08995 [Dysgonamonadaceae bacterium]|nr:hypothetical protein [Dysgonamonadaceae bacterium]